MPELPIKGRSVRVALLIPALTAAFLLSPLCLPRQSGAAASAQCDPHPSDVRLCYDTGGRWNYDTCTCEYP